MEGFYLANMSGTAGKSMLLFVVRKGKLVGADVGGLKCDGTVRLNEKGSYKFTITYVVPAGASWITDALPSAHPVTLSFTFDLPREFADGRMIMIETPRGPVNASFQKIRDL